MRFAHFSAKNLIEIDPMGENLKDEGFSKILAENSLSHQILLNGIFSLDSVSVSARIIPAMDP